MAEAKCIDLLKKERISKQLRVNLDEWKEVIVLLSEIIKWKKKWFPAATISCVTGLFLYVWLVNCSTLNMIWTTCLCATLLDCFVCSPFVEKMLPRSSWDEEKERTYVAFTESLAEHCVTVAVYSARFFRLRQTNTRLFHSVLSVWFFVLLYIGITFNNLLISYITVLAILLYPGLKMRSEYVEESLQRHFHLMMSYLWSSRSKTS